MAKIIPLKADKDNTGAAELYRRIHDLVSVYEDKLTVIEVLGALRLASLMVEKEFSEGL